LTQITYLLLQAKAWYARKETGKKSWTPLRDIANLDPAEGKINRDKNAQRKRQNGGREGGREKVRTKESGYVLVPFRVKSDQEITIVCGDNSFIAILTVSGTDKPCSPGDILPTFNGSP
jgi:hypothetical protein